MIIIIDCRPGEWRPIESDGDPYSMYAGKYVYTIAAFKPDFEHHLRDQTRRDHARLCFSHPLSSFTKDLLDLHNRCHVSTIIVTFVDAESSKTVWPHLSLKVFLEQFLDNGLTDGRNDTIG